ncbi:MAG: hypothetical protein ACI4XS_01670 [Bacillus sp. (in: firmicutes)]
MLIAINLVMFHIADEMYDDGKINIDQLHAVSRLAGSDYATIGRIFSIERSE